MSLAALSASKRIERHLTSSNELAGLRKLITRDLNDATVPGLSPDRTFATAYNAVLQLSKMALACAGYRVSATLPGHHQTTFEAAGLVLGTGARHFTDYFETCRRKRNVIDYDSAEVATERQAAELLEKATQYHRLVEAWIAKNHPKYRAWRQPSRVPDPIAQAAAPVRPSRRFSASGSILSTLPVLFPRGEFPTLLAWREGRGEFFPRYVSKTQRRK